MAVKKVNLSDKEIEPFLHKLIYFDKRNRDSASSTLYFCSYHFFNKVDLFKNLEELKKMEPKDVNSANFIDLIFDYKIDCLKIIAGIENYMKAVLLDDEIVIHSLNYGVKHNKQFQQKLKPIKIQDVFPDIKTFNDLDKQDVDNLEVWPNTITMASMLKQDYMKIIGLDPAIIRVIDFINTHRNNVHLSLKMEFFLGEGFVKDLEILKDFNEKTVLPKVKSTAELQKIRYELEKPADFSFITKPSLKEMMKYGNPLKGKD